MAERSRRIKTEAIVQRSRGGGGIRRGEFPSARDVARDVEGLAHHALMWTDRAAAVGGSNPALLETTRSVLESAFLVCGVEVKRCLDGRLRNLSEFLGHGEPVALSDLSGGDSMNLDTQYVLYECLCRNFRGIVSTESDRMEHLAGRIEERCGGTAEKSLARRITSGDAWVPFESLMKKFIGVFVAVRWIGVLHVYSSVCLCRHRAADRFRELGVGFLPQYIHAGGRVREGWGRVIHPRS